MQRRIAIAAVALVLGFAANAQGQTPPAAASTAAVVVSQDVLSRYVGRYRLNPDVEVTITLEDGKLYGALTGRPRHELSPRSPTTFVGTDTQAQVSFELGPDGRVTGAGVTIGDQAAYAPRVTEGESRPTP